MNSYIGKVCEKKHLPSYGKSQILLRDYKNEREIEMVILEICEEVCRRARNHNHAVQTISLGLSYSKDELGGGFLRSKTIEHATNETIEIYKICLILMKKYYNGQTVRQISVSLSNLVSDTEFQLDLFDNESWKKRKLGYVIDDIRKKFGSASILRAVSFTSAGTALQRSKLIGGHKA